MPVNSISLPSGFAEGSYHPILDTSSVLPANYVGPEIQNISPNPLGQYLALIPSYAPFFAANFLATSVSANLIANGGPFANDTGWNAPTLTGGYGGGSIMIDGTSLRLTNDSSSTHYGISEYSFATVVGGSYTLTVADGLSSDPGMYTNWWKADAAWSGTAAQLTGSGGVYTFTATATTTYISFSPSSSAALGWIDLDSVSVVQNKTLVSGTDFYFAYPFISASRAIGQPIFGGISLIDRAQTSDITLYYQTLGGDWITAQASNAAALANNPTFDPCGISWEQVNNYPNIFPVITTPWNMLDQTSLSAVTSNLEIVRENISNLALALDYGSEISHMVNKSNPHSVTSAMVSLNLVANYPPATNSDALDNAINNEYINAAQVNSMMHTGLTQATSTVAGVMRLNQGLTTSDGTDATSALTAAGFANLISTQNNPIGRAFNLGQQIAYVISTPHTYPFTWNSTVYFNQEELARNIQAAAGTLTLPAITYPLVWNGVTYSTQAAFIAAVAASVSLSSLEYSSIAGCFWFPDHITLPSLIVVSG